MHINISPRSIQRWLSGSFLLNNSSVGLFPVDSCLRVRYTKRYSWSYLLQSWPLHLCNLHSFQKQRILSLNFTLAWVHLTVVFECLISFSLQNSWNSSDTSCGPLSDLSVCGRPCLLKISYRQSITLTNVVDCKTDYS